ncbi:MAG TPA: LCP family protein [Acidimicrobiales bacterium]|nr:LCP family protein [Acidimicrobiales bacterium]
MAVQTPVRGARGGRAGTPAGPSRGRPIRVRPRWPRLALVIANLVVLCLLALGATAYGYVQWRLGQVNRVSVKGLVPAGQNSQSPPAGAGAPITILAVGSDTRSLGKGANAIFGNSSEVTGQRSDTIMLLRVVPASSSIALLSIPRDLLVPVAGMGTTRINATFNGGPNLLVSTIESDLGIDINHFMVVNFYSFTQIADALGGVYQYFPTPARDLFSDLSVPHAGCVLLKGEQALAFVRSREYQYYSDGQWQYQLVPESDLARIQRQQAFVKLAIKKTEAVGPTNPLALNSVIGGVTRSLIVDNSFSSSLILSLVKVLRHANAAGIPDWTYPTVNSYSVPGALDPVPSEDQAMVKQFLSYGMPATTSALTTSGKKVNFSLAAKVFGALGAAGPSLEAAGASSPLITTPASQIETDSSSYYEGEYVPPGLQPGQVPEKCPS